MCNQHLGPQRRLRHSVSLAYLPNVYITWQRRSATRRFLSVTGSSDTAIASAPYATTASLPPPHCTSHSPYCAGAPKALLVLWQQGHYSKALRRLARGAPTVSRFRHTPARGKGGYSHLHTHQPSLAAEHAMCKATHPMCRLQLRSACAPLAARRAPQAHVSDTEPRPAAPAASPHCREATWQVAPAARRLTHAGRRCAPLTSAPARPPCPLHHYPPTVNPALSFSFTC
ncbi:hypothetical protein TraAM80_04084 [Trypanosoma rangeli]|uniref:Uncharacterized protein n=1 Tax=Trypanosoma rangeli TaxID=5698 RepID=A0A3R7RKW2_TRYRA|nr:uncharacterized protein TraAM80_04084 [Trypanosoma rangeli]RNF06193.1 hypothetical protein TraAM80_04084 [Trypanosoma rangeli]|eukprot:RNF06193.1 hypothetical protein TraAM80_04084 [Trypanosoma rangeli]